MEPCYATQEPQAGASSTTSLVRAQSSLTGSCSKLSWRPWSPGLRRVFFFLSGYLITSLLSNEARKTGTVSLKGFYLRRVLRIFPPCYLTVIIVSLLAAAGLVYNRESYASLVSAFLYFSNYWNILGWGNLPAGLGILWSLAVEEHYYLLFPLLYAWFVRRSVGRRHQAGILIVLCLAALAWRCYRSFVMHSSWEDIYEGTDTRFDSILAGCVLAI